MIVEWNAPIVGVQNNSVVILETSKDGSSTKRHEMDPVTARLLAQRILQSASLIDGCSERAWVEKVEEMPDGKQKANMSCFCRNPNCKVKTAASKQ